MPQATAIGAGAIPLREAAPSRRAEDLNAHNFAAALMGPVCKRILTNAKAPASGSGCYIGELEGLQFGVGVRADFAVQSDFFVLRCGPFHGYDSLALVEHRKNNTETE